MPRYQLGEAPLTPPPPDYTEEDFKIVWPLTLQQGDHFDDLRTLIDADGDFIATDVYGTSTGAYSVMFRNAGLRAMSTSEISNVNAIGTAQFPVTFGAVKYPAAGQISISITNQLAGVNTIELIIHGIKQRWVGR